MERYTTSFKSSNEISYSRRVQWKDIPQVLNPAMRLAGVSAWSQALENRKLKINFVITFPGFFLK